MELLPQSMPAGLKVHACDVEVGVPVTQVPVALQVRGVVTSGWVPLVEHPPPDWLQVPGAELLPQSMPAGLKVHACDVEVGVPVTQVPIPLQVRGVVTSGWVPLVEQPPPDWLQVPGAELLPQSKPRVRFAPLVHVGTPGVRQAMTPTVQGFEFPVHELPTPGHEAAHAPPAVHVPPGHICPTGLNEQLTVVGEGVPATHAPALVQVLTVVVLVCVPVSGQPPAPATHEPVIIELLHTVPDGLKVHACDVTTAVPRPQAPADEHTLGVVVTVCVPVVEQVPLPVWVHGPSTTLLAPHEAPVFGVSSLHCSVPVAHEVRPLKQVAFGLVVHVTFGVQPQAPLPSQTRLPVHGVLAGFGLPSTQREAPVPQATRP